MPIDTINCIINEEDTIKINITEEEIIRVEISDGGLVVSSAAAMSGILLREDLTSQVDGINADFIISNNYIVGTLKIWINGLKERLITEINNTTFRLSPAPDTGDSVEVEYIKDDN